MQLSNHMKPGLSATFETVVSETDTAVSLGSGDVPVLGTPRVIALAEHATVLAVQSQLLENQTTVGVEVQLRHRRASGIGTVVSVRAELVEVDGASLMFEVEAREDDAVVAVGKVRRAVVDRDAFLASVR